MTSIEFAHIYLDEVQGQEQYLGKEALINLISTQEFGEVEVITLIDDYNALNDTLDVNEYKVFLNDRLNTDVKILWESDMIFYSQNTLEYLKEKDADSYRRYIEKYNKYPCSLLAMTSYLIRLGLIKSNFDINPSSRIINILATRFQEVEDLAIKRLARSRLSGIENSIETIYIESNNGLYKPRIK